MPPSSAKSLATRESILRSTVRALRTRGVHGIRVEEIAADAGISTGLLYYHFTDRSALVQAGLQAALGTARPDNAEPATAPPDTSPTDTVERQTGTAETEAALRAHLGGPVDTAVPGRPRADALRMAVFDEQLRAPVARATAAWEEDVRAAAGATASPARVTALTALVDGLRQRVDSRVLDADRAATLLHAAVLIERASAVRRGGDDGC